MAKQHNPGFLKVSEAARRKVREVSIDDVARRLGAGDASFVLLDVREDHEWAKGHLPGATHLGRGILERDIETRVPGPDTEIIIYCGGGFRSALAAESLKTMGYTNVASMWGGIRGWQDAGHSLTIPKEVKA
jgi:rhodanese-related sulfurtransferase